ncbi:hypothetical protein RJT34_28339 [Clitoria ternatea]|uniref:Uncharacterized protein n=1 Tax=Clitoria ternatea TaxID=43366 RepID=A0AAN9FDK8_CLITE
MLLTVILTRISLVFRDVEFGTDGSIKGETLGNATLREISSSIADESKMGSTSFNPAYKQDQDDNTIQDSYLGDDAIRLAIPAAVSGRDKGWLQGNDFGEDRKLSSGKWVVTQLIKEHTHPLTPVKGRRDCTYEQYPNQHDKIRELSQQLAVEKKRSATYKRHLDLLFEHILRSITIAFHIKYKIQHSRHCEGDGNQRTTES